MNSANRTTPGRRQRRVLMISYAFPPTGGPGVQRSAKFAKYLGDFGWEPIVWCAPAVAGLPPDASLLTDLPLSLDRRTHGAMDGATWADRFSGGVERLVSSVTRNQRWAKAAAWRSRMASQACIKFGMIPDHAVLWGLSSLGSLRRLIYQKKIDVIFTTYSPPSNHLLGWLLSRATRRPWVADFRDLWTDDFRYLFRHGPAWRRAIDRCIERVFLRNADAVIGVTDEQTKLLSDRVETPGERFLTITNGVDLDDFDSPPPTQESELLATGSALPSEASSDDASDLRGKCTLTYVGRFRTGTFTPAFFEGLASFADALGDERDRFELKIVGQISQDMRRRLGACGVPWTMTGYLPHRHAVAEMQAADVLLLGIAPGLHTESIMTGKAFEYLAAGKPVLVVAPPNCAASKLILHNRAGLSVKPEALAIEHALTQLWHQWRNGTLPQGCQPDRLAPYTRRNLTAQLAAVLEAVRTRRSPATAATGRITTQRSVDATIAPILKPTREQSPVSAI